VRDEPLRQHGSVHLRHDDIRDQEINIGAVRIEERARSVWRRGREHSVAPRAATCSPSSCARPHRPRRVKSSPSEAACTVDTACVAGGTPTTVSPSDGKWTAIVVPLSGAESTVMKPWLCVRCHPRTRGPSPSPVRPLSS